MTAPFPAGAEPAPRAAIASFGYHDVCDVPNESGFTGTGAAAYKLDRPRFQAHLDAIAAAGLDPELVSDVDPFAPGRHVLLTFDDAGSSAIAVADELSRRGWRGHFFVPTARIGERGFLGASGVKQLHECGHVVGSHSHTHPHIFREQSFVEMLAEWRTSCDRLAQLLGAPCVVASVPGGDISAQVLASAAAAGLRVLFTSEPTVVPQLVDGCFVLGRYAPKVSTDASRVGELARFQGWRRAMAVRRFKETLRVALPGVYRLYVRGMTRERGEPAGA